MDNSLMGYVGAFIAVAIMLGIGTLILGGSVADCTGITGYPLNNATGTPTRFVQSNATAASDAAATGWAQQCVRSNTQSQAGYNLLIITLIVLAAVVVLTVVRMLS